MASALRSVCKTNLMKLHGSQFIPEAKLSTFSTKATSQKLLYAACGAIAVGGAGLLYTLDRSVRAEGMVLHPPKLPWPHRGPFSSFDHASIRRGYQVYKEVCAACHSLQFVAYRHLVDVCMTEAEAKAEAAEKMIADGPDDKGEMFTRPGKLSDNFPDPYPNDEAAKDANNGAAPPDLSYITFARHGGEDYIFYIMTGYTDPPAGIAVGEGQHYNPYFLGGAISMAQPLYNEVIEFPDGTPATQSQCAKDVITFLAWCASPEHDYRKKLAIKALIFFGIVFPLVYRHYRHIASPLKNRKIIYKPVNQK